jgi:hypothetical protein
MKKMGTATKVYLYGPNKTTHPILTLMVRAMKRTMTS